MNDLCSSAPGHGDRNSMPTVSEQQVKFGSLCQPRASHLKIVSSFPDSLQRAFTHSPYPVFRNPEVLFSIPDYRVSLPPLRFNPSESDLFVLARGGDQLITIMVSCKGAGPFGDTVADWRKDPTIDKQVRLQFISDELGVERDQLDPVDCRILHRTAAALSEAKRFNAQHALVLIHSFSLSNDWCNDYQSLLSLFNATAEPDTIIFAKRTKGINLYFSWVRGV
jgi:hypothetical protein